MKNTGIWQGIGAYTIWGFFPLYWKLLQSVPAMQIVVHRMAWSLVFFLVVLAIRNDWAVVRAAFKNRRTLGIYALAAGLLSVNWLTYIWAVNAGFVVETSLGYFINPLVNVLLGVIFIRERLGPSKWIPVGLAAIGVLYLTISYGSLPWISLALAFSFGFYGLVKKLAPLGSLYGLTVETSVLILPAVGFLIFEEIQGVGAFGHAGLLVNVLLILAGVVTAIPLLLFSSAAQRIPLSTMGILQYIAPTLQFFLGVFIYQEAFTMERAIGFGIIWLALVIFTLGGLIEQRRQATLAARSSAVTSVAQ